MKNKPSFENLLKAIQQAKGLTPYQISLYTAMLTCWQEQAYRVTFRVTRSRLMALSGIRSFATYHQCLRVLISRHYILYVPSFSKRVASQVTLLSGEPGT